MNKAKIYEFLTVLVVALFMGSLLMWIVANLSGVAQGVAIVLVFGAILLALRILRKHFGRRA